MLKEFNRKLIFEDGNEYLGYSFGDTCNKVCEIVFNTSMAVSYTHLDVYKRQGIHCGP